MYRIALYIKLGPDQRFEILKSTFFLLLPTPYQKETTGTSNSVCIYCRGALSNLSACVYAICTKQRRLPPSRDFFFFTLLVMFWSVRLLRDTACPAPPPHECIQIHVHALRAVFLSFFSTRHNRPKEPHRHLQHHHQHHHRRRHRRRLVVIKVRSWRVSGAPLGPAPAPRTRDR